MVRPSSKRFMTERITLFLLAISGAALSGCQSIADTWFAHVRLSERNVAIIAQANAFVNACSAAKAIDSNVAFAFSNASSQVLDITVIDRDFYKTTYESQLHEALSRFSRGDPAEVRAGCEFVEKEVKGLTVKLTEQFIQISNQLAIARSVERQQMAAMLSGFGQSTAGLNYSTTYGWPKVTFVEQPPTSFNVLVNTKSGLTHCRVTSKNFVFCL